MTHDLHTLTELGTLEHLVTTQGLDALLAHLDTALVSTPPETRVSKADGLTVGPRTLRILRKALSLDAAFLREHPGTLFQCLYNRLRWFDAPDAAPHYTPEGKGPWSDPDAHLFALAEHWRRQRESRGGPAWVESLLPLGGDLEGDDQVLPHGAQVLCARYNPAGTRLATGSWEDGDNVRVWDVATGECLQVMEGHEAEVRGLAWSADGKLLASGSRDHDARIWDAETGALLHAMPGQEGQVTAVAFSPDGRCLATANLGWLIHLFDVDSGRKVRTLRGHEQSVLCLSFHPSGRWLASGASDDTARVWDMASGAEVACLESDTTIESVAFSPDGERLALTALDGISLYETRGWTPVGQVARERRYSHISWIDDTRLGLLTFDRVDVVDARSGATLRTRPYESDGHQREVAFHPGGKRYALTAADGRARVSGLDAEPRPRPRFERYRIENLWGRPEGDVGIARARQDAFAIDATGRVHSIAPDYAEAPLQPWQASPDGRWLARPLMNQGRSPYLPAVALLDARTFAPQRTLAAPASQGQGEKSLFLEKHPIAFSPDSKLVAASVEPGAVRLWRVSDGALLHTLRGPKGPVTFVDFTPDGACVMACYPEKAALLLYDVKSGARVVDTEAIVHPQPAYAAAAHAPRIAVGQESGDLEFHDLSTATLRRISVAKDSVIAVSLSSDGALVAACGLDERVRVFDTSTGALRYEVPHPSLAWAVAVGEDVLVTLADDQVTRLFDLATGAPRAELRGSVTPEDLVSRRFWEVLGDGPVAFHQGRETTPTAWFPDGMEEVLILRDGLVLGRGHTEKDFLYVLRLHASSPAS